jgi:hypothetical protein
VTAASWPEPTQAALMPERLLPVIVTTVPGGPESGPTDENVIAAPDALDRDAAATMNPPNSDERQRIRTTLVRFTIIPHKKINVEHTGQRLDQRDPTGNHTSLVSHQHPLRNRPRGDSGDPVDPDLEVVDRKFCAPTFRWDCPSNYLAASSD